MAQKTSEKVFSGVVGAGLGTAASAVYYGMVCGADVSVVCAAGTTGLMAASLASDFVGSKVNKSVAAKIGALVFASAVLSSAFHKSSERTATTEPAVLAAQTHPFGIKTLKL